MQNLINISFLWNHKKDSFKVFSLGNWKVSSRNRCQIYITFSCMIGSSSIIETPFAQLPYYGHGRSCTITSRLHFYKCTVCLDYNQVMKLMHFSDVSACTGCFWACFSTCIRSRDTTNLPILCRCHM